MSATLIPLPPGGSSARRPRAGLAGDPDARLAVGRTRRTRTPPVVPTDCATCLSAGSVRRGICDICGDVVA